MENVSNTAADPNTPSDYTSLAWFWAVTTRFRTQLDSFLTETAQETSTWTSATKTDLTSRTRQRLESVRNRSWK